MPKTLPPTLREKNRYMTFEVCAQRILEKKEVVSAILSALLRTHGEVGASKTSLWVIDWDGQKSRGILKTNHMAKDMVKSAMAMIREIDKKPAAFHVLKTSGTLKKAKEFM